MTSLLYSQKTDADLMTLISKGDKKAFEEILDRYQNGIYGFAFNLLRNSHEAEDIAQEVFLRLYANADAQIYYGRLETYLFKIARNLCIDHLRKKRPLAVSDLPEQISLSTPLSQLCAFELKDKIESIFLTLPKNQRSALYLRHIHGMNYRDIARTLDITVRAVESLLARGRKTLRAELNIYDDTV